MLIVQHQESFSKTCVALSQGIMLYQVLSILIWLRWWCCIVDLVSNIKLNLVSNIKTGLVLYQDYGLVLYQVLTRVIFCSNISKIFTTKVYDFDMQRLTHDAYDDRNTFRGTYFYLYHNFESWHKGLNLKCQIDKRVREPKM